MAEYRSRRQGLDTVRGMRSAPPAPTRRGRSAQKAAEKVRADEQRRERAEMVTPLPEEAVQTAGRGYHQTQS